jgi:SAM-dependent methyltransferase
MIGRYDARRIEQHFDEYWEKEWDRLVRDPAEEVKLHVHRHYLKKYVRSGNRVLEIGPGPGRFTQTLAEIEARIVVVDISRVQLGLNRAYGKKLGFDDAVEARFKLDMCDMAAFEDETFDAVVCYGGLLSYVFEKSSDGVREMLRVLRPGGILLASVASLWGTVHQSLLGVLDVPPDINRRIIISGDLCPETYPQREGKHHMHMFRSAEFRDLLEGCGAEVLEMAAANCLSTAWGDRLTDVRNDPAKWNHLLEMELEACRDPSCVGMSAYTIAVCKKEISESNAQKPK